MKIGELAKLADCTVETIRYYEKEGLLPPSRRTDGNYRDFDASLVERLRLIRNCRLLDMTQEEIRAILNYRDHPNDNCQEVNALIDHHIGHVTARIQELQHLQEQLITLRQQCQRNQATRECGIIKGLEEPERFDRTNDHEHCSHTAGVHGHRPAQPHKP
ncbi:Cd(II)/Pb(II)-responsive transcriptional regulator [Chitinivorax tropicus]|uniref:Cd(II)/Pb(II)-responsive transcriptional regulator n=1 Tax=Chitinivorax tropicus TaxID=714531 RepID=A0A840MJG1_9PROT|nr:Cd(II)/Pb(II)-responsive transcriptional regulator [Chitinivorax tropicus]MBB5016822.1 Cd(II)/Pb(II)-responsive transcriptional regulator [Chitinivorax tropicus]